MIPASHTEAPARDRLAALINGTPLGRDSIAVGPNVVWCSPLGVVRVNGTPIGRMSDGVEALAAEFKRVVSR